MMGWFLFLEGPSLELEAESSADWKNQRKPQKASATGQTSSASLPLLRRAQLGLCFASFVSKMWLMEFIFSYIFPVSLVRYQGHNHLDRLLTLSEH